MGKRKAETVLSDTVGYYHRSKLCCLGIFHTICVSFIYTLDNLSIQSIDSDCGFKDNLFKHQRQTRHKLK